jgi:hypothetical protein
LSFSLHCLIFVQISLLDGLWDWWWGGQMSTFWLETVGIGLVGHRVGLSIITNVRVAAGHDLFGVFWTLLGVVAGLLDLDAVAGLEPVEKGTLLTLTISENHPTHS